MFRPILSVAVAAALVAGAVLALTGAMQAESDPDSATRNPTEPSREVSQHLIAALEEALETESLTVTRIHMAKALTRIAPDHVAAANVLVTGLTSSGTEIPLEAYNAITEIIPMAPPALLAALTPTLQHDDPLVRRRAAILLSKIELQALRTRKLVPQVRR